MDFSWTDEEIELKRSAIKFAQKELNSDLIERDSRSEFRRDLWEKCARYGIQGLAVPEYLGGSGADILTTLLVMEGLGYGCEDNGLILSLNAQMWSVQHPILHFGSERQKEKYLPLFCNGTIIGAHGMTEPGSGSDAFSLETRADRVANGYVLNGSKTFVTNAPIADISVVFANVAPEKGKWGVTAFIIEKETQGYSISKNFSKLGLRTSPMSEIFLQDCFLPESSRLGSEGAGMAIFNSSMDWERNGILASAIGTMERQLEACIEYARKRVQFGKPIGKFQSVANRIVDMKIRLETARLILYKCAWQKKKGQSTHLDSAMAKVYLSEAFVQSGLDAIQIHGGYGFMTETGVERNFRDAIGSTFYSGTSDIQRVIIARMLGL